MFMKETKGLTETEIKPLYWPKTKSVEERLFSIEKRLAEIEKHNRQSYNKNLNDTTLDQSILASNGK